MLAPQALTLVLRTHVKVECLHAHTHKHTQGTINLKNTCCNKIDYFNLSYNAYLFIPISLIADEGGPIKIMPSCLQSSANSMFSERNPYPGWMAYKREKAQPIYWLAELWCWHCALLWGDPDMANKTPRPLS